MQPLAQRLRSTRAPLSGRGLLLRQQQGHEPGGKVDQPGAGEEPRRLLHALQEGADSGEAWQQERSHRLGAKDDRYPEERQSAGRVRDQERAADHRQLEVRINSDVAGPCVYVRIHAAARYRCLDATWEMTRAAKRLKS